MWTKISPEQLPDPKEGPFLCTNNASARNAHGRPSHVFLVNMFHRTDGPEGPVTAYAEPSDQLIWGVTHYQLVEAP